MTRMMKVNGTKAVVALVFAVTFGAARMPAQSGSGYDLFQKALAAERADGNLTGAIALYELIAKDVTSDRALTAKALVRLGECYQKLGDARAPAIFERVVREFGDQKDAAAEARTRLAGLQPAAVSAKQTPREVWRDLKVCCRTRPDTVSPDGRYVGFVDDRGNQGVRDLIRGIDRLVTDNKTADWAEYAGDSVVSSDGREVAYDFYSDKDNTHTVELRIASIGPGEPLRTVVVLKTPQTDYVRPMAWLPGGKQLLVIRGDKQTNQVGILGIRDGTFRSIKSLEWRYPDLLSLSPDGRYVAYDLPAGDNGSPRDILVLALDGSQETTVVRNPANDSSPVWSPDGSQLLFLSDRTGSNALWTLPIQDGRANGPAALKKPDVGAINVMGMTRGGTLYYRARTGGHPRNLYAVGFDANEVTQPPVRTTERLINANNGAAWSRNGEYLAYYSFRDSSTRLLVIRSAKTGEERTLALPARVTAHSGPKWFPDNRSVLVECGDAQGSGFGFYRLALDSGNTELLAHLRQEVWSYDLSADGQTIFYAGVDDGRVVRFDIESHRETELRKGSETYIPVSIAVSPDGNQLATTLMGGVVGIMSAAGDESRELLRPEPLEISVGNFREALSWTPDQRFLLWVRGDGDLWKVPAFGGTAEKVGLPMRFIKNLAIRPDGKQMVFDGVDEPPVTVLWALDGLLP